MKPPTVIVPIVEGHGEFEAVPKLLHRIAAALVPTVGVRVLRPIRRPKTQLVTRDGLGAAVTLASAKLVSCRGRRLILVLVDGNGDLACEVGPRLREWAKPVRSDTEVAIVVATVEFETWFVASAESLSQFIRVEGESIPEDPEAARCGKKWVASRFVGTRYSETIDQPALASHVDVTLCRRRSRSFDRLCRVIEARARE